MTKKVALSGKYGKGLFALVDDENFDELSQFNWYCSPTGYACRMTTRAGKRIVFHMHWAIVKLQPGFVIDHINGNRLDNRRCNLRICSRAENNRNRIGPLKPTSSKFKGVTWRNHANAWKAYIKFNGKQIHIGYFDDEKDAAKAYDEYARNLFGEFARPNFPLIKDTEVISRRRTINPDKHSSAKLTVEQVIAIRQEYATGEISQCELAKKHGTTRSNISNIVLEKTWTWLK